ncbi:hypothetical protein AAY24_05330 [Sedimenticola thiotaurini]|uniref:NolW-like domain-containing protein n=2 Tax=Sedimenticola thiotaurini TaxID=1543721 RepID=A0A0F7JYX8_9GAMM|nr:hypothetical protein AAY24_05330 [Sedimenticola thiotaurini]
MRHPLLLLILLFVYGQSAADYPLEIIQLKSRPVAEIIPILKPFIDSDGSISGMNDQLIIRTSAANLAEIRQILQRLDQPPRRLRISVRQFAGNHASQQALGADIDAMVGKQGRVIVGQPGDGDVRLRVKKAQTESHRDVTHTVQVLEGYPAFIATGQSVPIPERTTIVTRNTLRQRTTTQYRDVASGFYVVPRVNGNRVTLEISTEMNRPGNRQGHYDKQQVQSIVSGQLGEWISLGGAARTMGTTGHDILKEARMVSQDDRAIELLVEELHY